MRRIEQIIAEARDSTNTTDLNSVKNSTCQGYLNRIQSYMEDLLFLCDDENDLFISDYTFQTVPGQAEYDLPTNIYAKSSIDNLAVSFLSGLNNTYAPLIKISRKELGFTFGYFIREDKIVLSPMPTSALSMKLSYVRKLPTLGIRGGQIQSVGVSSITLSPGTYVAGFTDGSDYLCVVDKNGVIKQSGIEFVSDAVGVLTVSSSTAGITVGNYVVSGKYATTHSQLPDECEKYMLSALELMIQYRQSSPDFKMSQIFTEEDKAAIKEVFADNSYDDAKPPVTEWSEWVR